MKKILIALSFILITSVLVNAQTSPGSMMLGGTLDFSSTSYQGGNAGDFSSIIFSPSFGYFISDNFVLGTSLAIGSSRAGTGPGKSTSSFFGLGPFARYYKFTSSDNLAFFGEAGLSFAFGKTDPATGNVRNSNAVSFNVSPGVAYFFNAHWAMELSLTGFVVSSSDPDTDTPDDKVTSVSFGVSSLSPQIGLRYHF